MKRLLTTTALGLILATGPAMAQTNTTTDTPSADPQVQQMKPETGDSKPDMKLDNQPTTDDSTTVRPPQESAERPTATDNETVVTANFDGFRASDLIGATVENARGESVGEINDIVLGKDGSTNAALIGVGGFLGLGEKNIAIDFSELNVRETDGSLKITVAMSAEALEAMPAYGAENETTVDKPDTGMTPQNDAPAGENQPAERPNQN